MPRYFFRVERVTGTEADEVGTDLPGPEEARKLAVAYAAEILRDGDGAFWDTPEWLLRITDDSGVTVCWLMVRGAIRG